MIVDVVFGFLGSGKTTFISRILEAWGAGERIVVLVNEFGDVGIDGSLLASSSGNVVEMPSGCICCTLQSDFRNQIVEINRRFKPKRIIIEPSGVATIGQIQQILAAQLFEETIEKIHKILITDATGFMGLYKANPNFVENQVSNAHLVLLNKCDRVDARRAELTQSAISALNPEITVFKTEHCALDWQEYFQALAVGDRFAKDWGEAAMAGGDAPPSPDHPVEILAAVPNREKYDHPHISEDQNGLGYESFGLVYEDALFNEEKLASFFQHLTGDHKEWGRVVRAKGIFCLGAKWQMMELASGEFSRQPVRPFQQSKVSLIGKALNRDALRAALASCRAKERE